LTGGIAGVYQSAWWQVPDSIRIVPLGGLGEFGMNCMAVETDDDVIVIDCGVMFPERGRGVELIHPDFSYLEARQDRVRAVVLTHGHEDHIGALPFLLSRMQVPVYGPAYALSLARERLREHGLEAKTDLRPTTPRTPYRIGSIEVEPIRVSHSIVDATALALRTPVGTVLHTGDFNIDASAPPDQQFDTERLRELGREGVRLALSDSTNVDVMKRGAGEAAVAEALTRAIQACPHRVVLALFASNIPRLRGIAKAAELTGRRICLLGRSVQNHVRCAIELGHLVLPSAHLVSPQQAAVLPRHHVLLVAAGTQAEPGAALSRLAYDQHSDLTLTEGDTAILSSRVIPGNEKQVDDLISALERRGVRVVSARLNPQLHTSGHATAEEQRMLIDLLEPGAFLPIHGTYHCLNAHATLAKNAGVPQCLVIEDGAVAELSAESFIVAGAVPTGRVSVDQCGRLAESVLRERAFLAEGGVAVAIVVIDPAGKLASPPQIATRGIRGQLRDLDLTAEASQFVRRALDAETGIDMMSDEHVREATHRALRRFFGKNQCAKPVTHSIVFRVC
jgi:ribonuclease J